MNMFIEGASIPLPLPLAVLLITFKVGPCALSTHSQAFWLGPGLDGGPGSWERLLDNANEQRGAERR